jgi:hypothetical protein
LEPHEDTLRCITPVFPSIPKPDADVPMLIENVAIDQAV